MARTSSWVSAGSLLDRSVSELAGFEAEVCSFSAADSVSSQVTWVGAGELPPGRYRLRFMFRDPRVRLYSFGFEQA